MMLVSLEEEKDRGGWVLMDFDWHDRFCEVCGRVG